ncbi:MAG: nicotinamide-nucleotide amidase [Gammaproteobacteria bacterium]|nr:nicotinamide-nucleotide amidase [Gammaproteobacteria bacterium]MBU1448211.1 nicotinamide-nucleotide amidase [Gammaproteobacteria bacterium]MDD2929426.1 nicotinamide-nucleotide amidase [Sideroxydans sp.]
MDALAAQVGGALKAHGMMLATAESCTGGGIAQAVTSIAGSSAWFDRGFVTYTNLSKQQMLGVLESTLITYGAVSEAVVREMAEGVLRNSTAQVSLAVSGIAGPDGGTPDKPVGTVWFAWAFADGVITTAHHQFSGDRNEVRAQAVRVALQGVLERLSQNTLSA